MTTPKLKSINNIDLKIKEKIEKVIKLTLGTDYINAYPIEEFSVIDLVVLSEYAKENGLIVTLKAEHSNFHQGVMVGLIKKELASEFFKYL